MSGTSATPSSRSLGITAAVCTGIAASYYAYSQIRKRLPDWKEQEKLLKEVGSSATDIISCFDQRIPGHAPQCSP